MKPTITVVTPKAMMDLEELEGDDLLFRVAKIGRRCVINLAEDSRYLSKFCDKLEKDDLWKKIAPTWDEFCQEAFGHPGDYVDLIRAGVALLDNGDGKSIPLEDAKKAAEEKRKSEMKAMAENVPAAGDRGRPKKNAEIKGRLPTFNQDGRASEYLVARIKRDRPDIANRMVSGEFKSVNDAAKEAGIPVRPSVKLGSPETVVKAIIRLNGDGYVKDMIAAFIRDEATSEFITELRRILDEREN